MLNRRSFAAGCLLVTSSAASQSEQAGPYITRYDPQDWRLTAAVMFHQYEHNSDVVELVEPSSQTIGRRPARTITLTPRIGSVPRLPQQGTPRQTTVIRPDIPQVVGEEIPLEQGTVFWPFADRAASYEVDRGSVTGTMTGEGFDIPMRQAILDADASGGVLHSGAAYGEWTFGPFEYLPTGIRFEFTFDARAWNTRFDEANAKKVAWPTGDWPAEAASTFEPMLFIDHWFVGSYDRSQVVALAKRYTNDRPQSQPPVVTAKWIAGRLAEEFQPENAITVRSSEFLRVPIPNDGSEMEAINVDGIARASGSLEGTPMDLPLLLTALYREVGIPARIVVGYVAGGRGGAIESDRRLDQPEIGLYAWVEFALYDENQDTPEDALTWVPVDILSMRANNVGQRDFDRPWDGFGSSEHLSEIIPIGYHLHPHRLGATSYGFSNRSLYEDATDIVEEPLPSLWGWNLVPYTPELLFQRIVFSATTPSRSADDEPRDRGR